MGPDIAASPGRWYLRWDKGEIFQVTGQDAETGEITIRTYDGDVDLLSLDQWRELRPGLADPPCDWTGPVESVDELDASASLPPGFMTAAPSARNAIKRILVAVKEPGESWSPGLAKATQIARATGAQIELFHCVDAALTVEQLAAYRGGMDEFERSQRHSWEEGLERLASKVRSHGVHATFSAPVDHPVHEGIVRQARCFHADLIVTDAHRGSNFAAWIMEEVDWELVRLSTAPLLIVRQTELYQRPLVLAALDPSDSHSKPATLNRKLLNASAVFSRALEGDLHAMHAYSVPGAVAEAASAVSASVAAELQAIDAGRAHASLDSLLMSTNIPAECRHVAPGSPADAIVRTATELKASLLVMGSVARSGVGRLFIGNTAEKVLNRLPCDLLLLKPDDFANSIADQRRGARLISTGVYF
ncbi:MAG: universal stress protein [Proteobacteria bacterium]|nr:universal stress protein [Pseudomonadota bacterium]